MSALTWQIVGGAVGLVVGVILVIVFEMFVNRERS